MIRALVSDLGNVLLHFDHGIISRRLAEYWPGVEWTEDRQSLFRASVRSFEEGALTNEEFTARITGVMGVQAVTEEEFRPLWSDIFWCNQELLQLFTAARERLVLVLLSNTNPLHIAWARERFPEVFDLFDDHVFSYEVGMAKPDPAIYHEAMRRAGVPAGETLYFDDIAAYVDIASSLGMHAYQFVSVEGVREVLRIYDLLPPLPEQTAGGKERP
jgi:glucose-1-phosphatase